jgi:hypothetical protein
MSEVNTNCGKILKVNKLALGQIWKRQGALSGKRCLERNVRRTDGLAADSKIPSPSAIVPPTPTSRTHGLGNPRPNPLKIQFPTSNNGVQVLKDGEHTGAKPGRFVKGPGWKKSVG